MKKAVVIICILLMLCAAVCAAPVYKYEETVPITDTVTLTNVREFHTDHNISYSYIKMPLDDERIKLKLLTSDEGTDVLSYMSELAQTDENTVAAINGDFFSVYSGKKGFSLGIEKKDGQVLQSPINPDTMATVAYDGSSVLMTYLDFHIFAVAENWEYKEIRHINKHTSYYGDLLMYTNDFNGGYSPAPGGDVVEVVVEDGTVTQQRRNMEPCEIPENGCVLVISEGSSMFLADNFPVGSKIKFDWYFTPDLERFDTAFGAGSMLVYEGKDVGKVGDYTHTVAGFNPRSALGVDEKGEYLYLVAVDGRQEMSRGMRMSHLAELLIELGCYTAVNLDGGGSTRMLASTLWDSAMHPVNNPTENRRVINAVGIVLDNREPANEPDEEPEESEEEKQEQEPEESEEEKEPEEEQEQQEPEQEQPEEEQHEEEPEGAALENISGIKIRLSDKVAFVGEKTDIEIVAHDGQLRRVGYDEAELEVSVSQGEIEEGGVVCNTGGTVTVSAALGEHYAEAEVLYIDSISGIVTPSNLYMDKSQEIIIPIKVFDYSGRFLTVENTDAFEIVSSDEAVVTVENNKITAVGDGRAVVTVSKDDAASHISIAVGSYTVDYKNDFEAPTGKFVGYPAKTTKGSFELSDEYYLSGNYSGKLSFDFTTDSDGQEIELEEEAVVTDAAENPSQTAQDTHPEGLPQQTEQESEENQQALQEQPVQSEIEPEEQITETANETETCEITEISENTETNEATEFTEKATTDGISRAVYLSLYKKIVFAAGSGLRVNVYSEKDFHHEVRAQLIDGDGKVKNVKLDGEIVAGQWNELTLDAPEELKSPVSLSRLYVLYTPGEVTDSGSIYIDDISMTASVDYEAEITKNNVYRYNVNNSNVSTSVRMSALPMTVEGNPVSVYERARLEGTTLSQNGFVISEVGEKSVSEDDNAVYVRLDTSGGGIRKTDSSQWELLMQAAEMSNRSNLFVLLNGDIFGNDSFENEVIRDYLASLDKNVFVVSRGNSASYMNIDGVKYFTLDSTPVKSYSFLTEKPKNTIEFYFGNAVTFEFKSA